MVLFLWVLNLCVELWISYLRPVVNNNFQVKEGAAVLANFKKLCYCGGWIGIPPQHISKVQNANNMFWLIACISYFASVIWQNKTVPDFV